MPALLSENITRSRLPTLSARACVFSSCACPEQRANSPSKAMTFGAFTDAPMTSQNAALPAASAMPTPEGPPFTSFVRSVDSMWPDSARMPRPFRLREERMVGELEIR